MCSPPVGVDKGEGEWAGVSVWRRGSSQGQREKGTQCSWFGIIGSSGGGGMRSGAALMSACVGGASGARPPAFCGAGCGERREARAPPRPPPRDDHAGVSMALRSSAHPPLASHARLAHAARLGRCPNDRRAGARCFKVCLCLFAATPNPRASVRVRRASPHAGEARAAPQPSHLPPPRGGEARGAAPRVCVC